MLITTAEAAERTGRAERTVRRMCERGDVRAVKVGNHVWLLDADAADEMKREGAKCKTSDE